MEETARSPQRIPVTVLVLLSVMSASCRVTSQAVVQSQQDHNYERLDIIYRAHSASGLLFAPIPANPSPTWQADIVQVAGETSSEPPPVLPLCWSKPELRIEYPHPDGQEGCARITLYFLPMDCGEQCNYLTWRQQFEERTGLRESRRDTFRERVCGECCRPAEGSKFMEMDLPRAELDNILRELYSHQFFEESGNSSDSASELEVRLNRRWTSKPWRYEPKLDDLTTRVYQEGRLRTVSNETAERTSLWSSTAWLKPLAPSK